jgi:AcrR family transcriptional regulator|tara:strand:+ start:1539 stop:2183 length:645 start_codon:yes stop_codon:yes gene_type:complete
MTSKTNYHHGDLRRALLSAAEEELSEKGVEAFSLRGVAKRAGVSHGAPAHHFEDARGLLTELAAQGYQRFIDAQELRQGSSPKNAEAQLAASGLGYIDFATENPALFRLMFSSERPDKSAAVLAKAADSAFDKLVTDIEHIAQTDPHGDQPAMTDVMAAWAIAHGLADLLIGDRLGRISFLAGMSPEQRDGVLSEIILRASTVKRGGKCHAPDS